MSKSSKSAAWLAVAMVAALCVIVCCWHRSVVGSQPAAPDTVRIVVRDTITITKPVAVSSKPIGITPVRLPLWVTTDSVQKSQNLNSSGALVFTATPDSATVAVPIESKVYADSNYRAVISGYMASLDTMQVYPRTEYVRIKPPPAKAPPLGHRHHRGLLYHPARTATRPHRRHNL